MGGDRVVGVGTVASERGSWRREILGEREGGLPCESSTIACVPPTALQRWNTTWVLCRAVYSHTLLAVMTHAFECVPSWLIAGLFARKEFRPNIAHNHTRTLIMTAPSTKPRHIGQVSCGGTVARCRPFQQAGINAPVDLVRDATRGLIVIHEHDDFALP